MIRSFLKRWCAEEDAVTATEYAMMIALVICVLISSITAVGNTVAGIWTSDVNQVSTACSTGS